MKLKFRESEVNAGETGPFPQKTFDVLNENNQQVGTVNPEIMCLLEAAERDKDYVQDAIRTESNLGEIVLTPRQTRLLHGVMGIGTEAGEMLDQFKRHIFYKKPLDLVNVEEEIGDIFWYCALLCDEMQVSFSGIMKKNIAKLKARYPDKFDSEKALNRNLEEERKALEGTNASPKP